MKALVLAGGPGVNMVPFTATRPKPLIPVAGQHVIDHTLVMLHEAGVSMVNLVVGHKSEALRSHFAGRETPGIDINFIEQGKSQSIGKAILEAKSKFAPSDNFLLVYGDTLTAANIFSPTLQSFSMTSEPTAAICLTKSGEEYGNVYLGQDMRITKFIEKPKKAGLGNYVLAGVFALPASFFNLLEKCKGDMVAALKALIKKGSLRAVIWEDDWMDMAYPWDILTANQKLMDRWTEASIHQSVEVSETIIRGPVKICEGAQIQAGSVLEGPAYIGPGSFIGHNTLIRPYTYVGAGSIIGQSAELKNCVLFPNTLVGRLTFIGDSVVGEDVDIGAGTMTINRTIDSKPVTVKIGKKNIDTGLEKLGAFIGDGAVIGASNIIAAGTTVGAGVMIQHNCSFPRRK